MATQSADLHRSLLRTFVINTLRGIGFHSAKPAVLESMVDIAERLLLKLAMTTAQYAQDTHNDAQITISDVRHALTECSILVPYEDATEEEFRERMRRPLSDYEEMKGGHVRLAAEARRRDEQDTRDVRDFVQWFDGGIYAEIRRVAGMNMDTTVAGVGGQRMHAEDVLSTLKKKYAKNGQDLDSRFVNTVLGRAEVDKPAVLIEGGDARSLRSWLPPVQHREGRYEETNGHDTITTNGAMITT